MALCVPLFFAAPASPLFAALYIACGVSDILDGVFARRFDAASRLGAILDSASDAVFFFVILAKLIPILALPSWTVYWIILIAAIRLASLAVGYVKYHAPAFLHTYANKAAGVLVFCFPLLYGRVGIEVLADIICGAASVSAVEELIINVVSKKLARDITSIFALHKKV